MVGIAAMVTTVGIAVTAITVCIPVFATMVGMATTVAGVDGYIATL